MRSYWLYHGYQRSSCFACHPRHVILLNLPMVAMLKLFIIIDEKTVSNLCLSTGCFSVFDKLMLLFQLKAAIIAVIILLEVSTSCSILKFSIF
jgi:hypothetical protein